MRLSQRCAFSAVSAAESANSKRRAGFTTVDVTFRLAMFRSNSIDLINTFTCAHVYMHLAVKPYLQVGVAQHHAQQQSGLCVCCTKPRDQTIAIWSNGRTLPDLNCVGVSASRLAGTDEKANRREKYHKKAERK